jgi:hypothetical protein
MPLFREQQERPSVREQGDTTRLPIVVPILLMKPEMD